MTMRSITRTLWIVALGGLVGSGAWAAGESGSQSAQDRESGYSEQAQQRSPSDAGSQRGVTGGERGTTGGEQERSQSPGMAGQQGQQQQQQQQPPFGQQQQEGEQQYVVREGDTLAGIAERFLGSAEEWEMIAEANDIQDPGDLRVGMRLTIPESEAATTGQRRGEGEPVS